MLDDDCLEIDTSTDALEPEASVSQDAVTLLIERIFKYLFNSAKAEFMSAKAEQTEVDQTNEDLSDKADQSEVDELKGALML